MRESYLESKIKAYANKQKCLCWKFTSPGTVGVPDRIIISQTGRVGFIEVKATNGKPSKMQLFRLKEINQKNVPGIWTDNLEEAKEFIDGLCTV